MLRALKAVHQSWALASPFRISRGVKISAEVVLVEICQGRLCGRGESVPYARYGETIESVLGQVEQARDAVANGISREELAATLPHGAARNAVDCALWDLDARLSGETVEKSLGMRGLPALSSALTIGVDTPEKMATAAAASGARLIKVKLDASDVPARLRAVRDAAPEARLIVDPNESWTIELLTAMLPVLVETRVELVEQPLPAAADAALEGLRSPIPICADESCHVVSDLSRLKSRYAAINIKLDKTGGLTGALQLLAAARAQDFQVMVGCMVCSSLGIAPAFHVARHADFVDLDGPLWLRSDYPEGVRCHEGLLQPPRAGFWGGTSQPS